MNTVAPSQPQAATTTKRVNKTNVDYASHHLNQAMGSLGRVRGQLFDMTHDRQGHLANELREADAHVTQAAEQIDAAWKHTQAVLTELEALFG